MSMRKGRYYERYQVEDVLTFFSGTLVSAKSPDGARVFLQEITLSKPLPPGAKEILINLENEHLAPILDVMEEKGRLVLVHPPMGGEPLSLLVQPRRGMEPSQALNVYRRLLRTAIKLSVLPIPLFTTLDPRNIIIEGNRPYVLFISFEKFTKRQADEKWRYLLHFLLTGFRMESRPENPEADRSIRELPEALKKLVLISMDPENSIQDVLDAAEKTVLPKQQKKMAVNKRGNTRVMVYSGIVAAIVITGIIVGNQFTNTPAQAEDEQRVQEELKEPGKWVELEDVEFQRQQSLPEKLSPSLDGSFRVRGELVQSEANPFKFYLSSENVESDFGLEVDDEGQLVLFHYVDGETKQLAKSGDQFLIDPKKEYFMEIFYVPDQSFRVAVTDQKTKEKWVSVGDVPQASTFNVVVAGSKGTAFKNPSVAKVNKEQGNKAFSEWMENQPWVLQGGAGVLRQGQIDLDGDTRIHLENTIDSFVFIRDPDFEDDPFRMRLDAVDGTSYQFIWRKNGQMELEKTGYESEKLDIQYFGPGWVPDQETRISIVSDSEEFGIVVEQEAGKVQLGTKVDSHVKIDNIIIDNQSWIRLIDK